MRENIDLAAGDEQASRAAGAACGREIFEANLPLVQGLLRRLCARHHFSTADGEDFSSYALLRMIENDYGVLRSFTGRSSLRTYLTTVTCRYLLDYRNHEWGKWHASARAKSLGSVGIRLEELIHRDGCSPAEAIGRLGRSPGFPGSDEALLREALAEIARRLPARPRRRFEGQEGIQEMPAPERADDRLWEVERAAGARRVRSILAAALSALPSDDRLILTMRFRDGVTVRRIADVLHLESRRLYRRIERCLRGLRAALEAQGLTRAEIADLRDRCGETGR